MLFRGVDMYWHAYVYTCLHALCLHSVDLPVSVALVFSALATSLERFRVFSAVGSFRPPNGVVLLFVVHR